MRVRMCIRRLRSFVYTSRDNDDRKRESDITRGDDAPGLAPVVTRGGETRTGIERWDASGRPPRDASAQRAPYLRYTFASKTQRTYLARLLPTSFSFPAILSFSAAEYSPNKPLATNI